jgi:acyl-CoA hydrolase
VDFVQTAHIGDIVEIGMDVVKFGTTSITICCDVRNKNTKNTIVKIDKIVFVLLDENGRPTPHGKTKVKR